MPHVRPTDTLDENAKSFSFYLHRLGESIIVDHHTDDDKRPEATATMRIKNRRRRQQDGEAIPSLPSHRGAKRQHLVVSGRRNAQKKPTFDDRLKYRKLPFTV